MHYRPGMVPEPIAESELAHQVVELLPDVVAVYLFGSYADGTSTPHSDVDLAVLGARPLRGETLGVAREMLADGLRRDVDLVDLRRASTVLRAQVVSTARLLLDLDPSTREQFETWVYSAYARLNEERREILERIRREGRIHG
jgi:predicted nucleotidyltransferase